PWFIAVWVMPAKAVPAMNGTDAGRHQQRPPVIFVQESRRAPGGSVSHRVGAETGNGALFAFQRHDLQQQWICRIARPDALEIALRDEQWKEAGSTTCRLAP